jgi:hypothetical protein
VGAGDFLAMELAKELGFQYESIANLTVVANCLDNATEIRKMASVCFPAYAVATLGMTALHAKTSS